LLCCCKFYYFRQGGHVIFVVACLSAINFAQGLPNGFACNFQGRLAILANEVAIRITVWIQGLFSGFITIGRYGKWLTDINLLLMLIRQMAALVRRALAEVRTVAALQQLQTSAAKGTIKPLTCQ